MNSQNQNKESVPEQPSDGWHLRKDINVGHIFTTIGLIFALMTWAHRMDLRITKLEDRAEAQVHVDRMQNDQILRNSEEVKAELGKLTTKLDGLIDYLLNQNNNARSNGRK